MPCRRSSRSTDVLFSFHRLPVKSRGAVFALWHRVRDGGLSCFLSPPPSQPLGRFLFCGIASGMVACPVSLPPSPGQFRGAVFALWHRVRDGGLSCFLSPPPGQSRGAVFALWHRSRGSGLSCFLSPPLGQSPGTVFVLCHRVRDGACPVFSLTASRLTIGGRFLFCVITSGMVACPVFSLRLQVNRWGGFCFVASLPGWGLVLFSLTASRSIPGAVFALWHRFRDGACPVSLSPSPSQFRGAVFVLCHHFRDGACKRAG